MMNVMIVDDEQWTSIYLERLINWESYGFKITSAHQNCMEALEFASKIPPDVLFLDIKMPGMNGLEFLEILRGKGIKPYTIVLSGYPDFHYAQTAISLSVINYCLKPLSREKLEEILFLLREKGKPVHSGNNSLSSTASDIKMAEIIDYIDQQYGNKLNITIMAEYLHITPNYCSKLFNKKFHTTFSEYLKNVRMQNAGHLLKTTNLTVKEIADKCGYSDYFYFLKIFKEHYGITVSKYRVNNIYDN